MCLSTILSTYFTLTPVLAQEYGPGPAGFAPDEPGTYVTWKKQHESATESWTWRNLAWEFGPYPSYVIVLNNGTEVTSSNFIPVNEDFKVIITIQKAIFTGNSTLGGAGLDWHMDILNATNPLDTLGWAHLRMGYVNQILSKYVPGNVKNGSFHVESQVFNRSEMAMLEGMGKLPSEGGQSTSMYPGGTITPPFYVWNKNASRVIETDITWIIEIVGGFNATRTPKGPYNVQLEIYDSSGNRIDFGYMAWEGTKSPYRQVAVGRPGLVFGGYGETWIFGKYDMKNQTIYSVARGAPWKMVVDVTAADFANVTIGFRLNDNIRTFVNVTNWYTRTTTEYGGWVYNSSSGTYYWNSSVPVARTEQVFGPHQEERWLWIPHKHRVNVTDSFWNFTTQRMELVQRTQEIWDEWMYLIYDKAADQFSVKQGYRYWSYDPALQRSREFVVLQDLNTSDPTTGFYNLNLTRSSAAQLEPGKWRIEFVGVFNSSILTTQDQYWINPPTVMKANGDQIWADWEHVNWGDFQIAVDRMVAITKVFDSKGREVTSSILRIDPGEEFTIQSIIQGALKFYNDLDAVGVRLRANSGSWSPNASYWSDVEIKLVYNKNDDTITSETYNRTEKSAYVYGPYKAWVEENVTGFHYEYNASSGSWDWVNGTFKQWNYTTIEGWHWSYWSLNQTAYAQNASSAEVWIDRNERWIPWDDPCFKVASPYATVVDANTTLVEGLIASNLVLVFNDTAPQTRYWWELIFGNLTFGADYSQGWGEHRVTEWTREPVYYVNSSQTGGQKWYVSKPSQPYSTLYDGTRYRVYETPYIVFGADLATGTKELIKTRTRFDYGRLEDQVEYLFRDPWNPVTQKEPRYYELMNGTKIYISEGYKVLIRDLKLNCTDAYVLGEGGAKIYLPNQTVITTFMDRAEEDWRLQYWDPVLSTHVTPMAYQLLNGTRVYRDSYMLWNGTQRFGFERRNWNSTLNRYDLSNKAYSENSTSLMVERGGRAVFLNSTICVPLRDDGSWWQSAPGSGTYYLVMKNGSRIFHPNPWAFDDFHRIVTINGKNYTISWPDDYYIGTWRGSKLTLKGGWQGYVRNFYYTTIGGSIYEMPYPGAFATSFWDLERLQSDGGKIPTVKSVKISGIVYQIYREGTAYYIIKNGGHQEVTKPEINPIVFYSIINGDEYWNVTQGGWAAVYGTYNMRTNLMDSVEGYVVTTTGYDPQSRRWQEWNKYGEDRENSTRYLLTSEGERIDVYEGRYLSIWPVTIGGVTYYTLDRWDKSEMVNEGGQSIWKQYITTIDGTKVYFDWCNKPASWGDEIHVELPGMNYTRLVPYLWENRKFLDKTYIYNITITNNRYITDRNGALIANGTVLQVWGTHHGPGVKVFYDLSGNENNKWIDWDSARQAHFMTLINGSRIYGNRTEYEGSYNFGWDGNSFDPMRTQFTYSGRAYSVIEGGYYLILIENGTWRRSVLETATQFQPAYPVWYVVLKDGTRVDFEDQGYGTIGLGTEYYGVRYITVRDGTLYWVEGGNRIETFYNVTYAGTIWRLYEGNLLAASVYNVPRIASEYERPTLWFNATSDKVLINATKSPDEIGYYYLVSANGTIYELASVSSWWTLSAKVRREIFDNWQVPWELRQAYPRYNITINGQEYFVIDPSPSRGWWQPGNTWDHGRYPATFQFNGTMYPIDYNQWDRYSWRGYNAIVLNGTKYELQDQWQWKAVYRVPINGVPNNIMIASENIYKEHTTWGPAYRWMLTDMNVQTIRTVMDIILGTPKEGMWGVKAFEIVPETGAVDLDGDLDTKDDQYYVRRIHTGTDEQNRTLDRMWVEVTWEPNVSKPGDEMHIGAWMGKVHNRWRFSWNESYIWYYASNMTIVSPQTMSMIKTTLVNNATGLPNPGYWEISRMAVNMTSDDLLAKAKAEGWTWMGDNSHEWEWMWFGTRQDYRTCWNESGILKSAGIGLQYEYAGMLLYNDTNSDNVMQKSETTHFFIPSRVGFVTFMSPGEDFGNFNDTGSLKLNLTDRVNFGVTFTNINGTLFPYNSEKPRDMWGWWGGTVYGADFATPNLNNRPTPTAIDTMQFAVHFNATTTSGNETNNEAEMKIDERYGKWSLDPEIIDGRTKLISGNLSTYLRGMETLQGRSLAASWYVTAFTDIAWSVKDKMGSEVSPDAVTISDAFDVGASLVSAKFATLRMGGTYDWKKPIAVNDTVRTFNVSSYTTPVGTFRASYISDSGKSSSGFGITASMYFLTVGFDSWDGYGVYHDPEISTKISKIAYSPPGPGPEPGEERTPTQITCDASPTTITKGLTVTISGAITPAVSNAPVTIQVSTDGGNAWTNMTVINTAASGGYSYEWRPTQARTYTVRATWSGNLLYLGATSAMKTVTVTEGTDYTMFIALAVVGLVAVAAIPILRRRK